MLISDKGIHKVITLGEESERKEWDVTTPEYLNRVIGETIDYYKTVAEEACAKWSRTRDEIRAEFAEQIDTLKEQIDRDVFMLTPQEYERFEAFKKFCYEDKEHCGNGNGNEFGLSYKGTGIGSIIYAHCMKCGRKQDITDDDKF